MWSLPIAIATGNTLVLKPSEKVPLTMNRVVALLKEAGVPDGVVNLVNGTVDGKSFLLNHFQLKFTKFFLCISCKCDL
jgi:malonate-semialdehyde dehydrogenase (acetylating)/methylmalonate-semialdehyde dehydrogenase